MKKWTISLANAGALMLSGLVLPAQETTAPTLEQQATAVVEHPECAFFIQRDKFQAARLNRNRLSGLTQQVTKMLSSAPSRSAEKSFQDPSNLATIDKYLFADMQANGVTPADKTND